jgi:hypothetical protein
MIVAYREELMIKLATLLKIAFATRNMPKIDLMMSVRSLQSVGNKKGAHERTSPDNFYLSKIESSLHKIESETMVFCQGQLINRATSRFDFHILIFNAQST